VNTALLVNIGVGHPREEWRLDLIRRMSML
jgi:hypothetical protein